jgi:hypothetical protein
MGMRKGAKLSVLNFQLTNAGKGTEAENRDGVTSQSPRGAASTQKRSGETQRLRAGVRQQVNLPKQTGGGGKYSKLPCPTLLGEELTKQSCS